MSVMTARRIWANVIPYTNVETGVQRWSVYNGLTGEKVVTVDTQAEAFEEAKLFEARARQ